MHTAEGRSNLVPDRSQPRHSWISSAHRGEAHWPRNRAPPSVALLAAKVLLVMAMEMLPLAQSAPPCWPLFPTRTVWLRAI